MSIPFAHALVSEELLAAVVDDWSLWQQYPETKAPTGAKFIPTKYHMQLTCMAIAGNDITHFDALYRRTRWSEVKKLQGLQAAATWRPPTNGEPEGDDTD